LIHVKVGDGRVACVSAERAIDAAQAAAARPRYIDRTAGCSALRLLRAMGCELRGDTVMRTEPSRILGLLAFALATLMATGALVAAGLNDEMRPVAQQQHLLAR
jgi:hypothetical protein